MSDIFQELENDSLKGFYNLSIITKDGKRRKIGGIADNGKLSKAQEALLKLLAEQGEDGHTVTLAVDYNETNGEAVELSIDDL